MAVTHEIKTVELAKLVPYEKNPNVHPIEQVKAMADSIERYVSITLSSWTKI